MPGEFPMPAAPSRRTRGAVGDQSRRHGPDLVFHLVLPGPTASQACPGIWCPHHSTPCALQYLEERCLDN